MSKKYERITDIRLLSLIKLLKKSASENNARIWYYVAELLERPRRLRAQVNISKIARYTNEGETVVVPGKVLGSGILNHKVNVAAFAFSDSARLKIREAGGRTMSIEELLRENPRGSNVKIIV